MNERTKKILALIFLVFAMGLIYFVAATKIFGGLSQTFDAELTTNNEMQTRSSDWWLEVTRGNVEGATRFAYGGNTLDLSSSDGIRDIWNGPGSRTDLSAATTLFVSSTDAGDTSLVVVVGMDDEFNEISSLAFLNGQNQVQFSADIWKVTVIFAVGGGPFNGALYVAEADTLTGGVPDTDSKVQLVSLAGFGFGAIANRTVPAGFTLFVSDLKITPNKGKDVTAYSASQTPGLTRTINPASFELFEYNFDTKFQPFMLPEKTDFMIIAETNDTNAPLSVLLEGVLIKN